MAFGGLGIMMFSGHSALSAFSIALRKVDLQSFFLASMFLIVLLVLAYLTNPSESSFRAYLTEQTFRQHLRRLDDDSEDNQDHLPEREDHGVHYTLARRPISPIPLKPPQRSSYDATPPFHFVNRASVSLRTPKHVFRTFGIMTIAAIVPTTKTQALSSGARAPGRNASSGTSSNSAKEDPSASLMLSDSWFIGAFGRWWRAGSIQPGWLETMANTKDAERCNSGILDVKALDTLEGYDGLPQFGHLGNSNSISRDQISAKFNRELSRNGSAIAPSSHNGNATHRSTTPPPLPKSASLPLHAPRVTPSSSSPIKASLSTSVSHASPPSGPVCSSLIPTNPPQPHLQQPSPTSAFDSSPIIASILHQISLSERTVFELHSQLTSFQSSSASSHQLILRDLEAQRTRKKEEDAGRVELKNRVKTLEESKRGCDQVKREAEKKLRAAESARDSAAERIGRLDREIQTLQSRISEDQSAMHACMKHVVLEGGSGVDEGDACGEEGGDEEKKLNEELEKKKKEIKVAEDVVNALNARAKELEEKILKEEERLRKAKEEAEMRRQDRDFLTLHVVTPDSTTPSLIAPWSSTSPSALGTSLNSVQTAMAPASANITQDPHTFIHSDLSEPIEVFSLPLRTQTQSQTRSRGGSNSSGSREASDLSSPRPRELSLAGISNFHPSHGHGHGHGHGQSVGPGVIGQEVSSGQLVPSGGFNAYTLGGDRDHQQPLHTDHSTALSTRFSPFDSLDNTPELGVVSGVNASDALLSLSGVDSPKSSSLIPTSLIQSLEGNAGTEMLADYNIRSHNLHLPLPRQHQQSQSQPHQQQQAQTQTLFRTYAEELVPPISTSRSFQSEDDDYMERDWRRRVNQNVLLFSGGLGGPGSGTGSGTGTGNGLDGFGNGNGNTAASSSSSVTTGTIESPSAYTATSNSNSSPTSYTGHSAATCSFDAVDREDPFEVRLPHQHQQQPQQAPLSSASSSRQSLLTQNHHTHTSELRRLLNFGSQPVRSSTDPTTSFVDEFGVTTGEEKAVGHRRWFSSPKGFQGHQPQHQSQHQSQSQQQHQHQHQHQHQQQVICQQEKKGLNPEAKVFQLTKSFALPSMFHTLPKRHAPFDFDPHSLVVQEGLLGGMGEASASASANPYGNHHLGSSVFSSSTTSLPSGLVSGSSTSLSVSAPPPPHSSSTVATTAPSTESSIFTTSMRAFAPSPAEREVLVRGLSSGSGSLSLSGNTSLERLPTLSQVSIARGQTGSMPPSPSNHHSASAVVPSSLQHQHQHQHQQLQQQRHSPASSINEAHPHRSVGSGHGLPPSLAWLNSFPRMRKPKFSPWEDDAPSVSSGSSATAAGGLGSGNRQEASASSSAIGGGLGRWQRERDRERDEDDENGSMGGSFLN